MPGKPGSPEQAGTRLVWDLPLRLLHWLLVLSIAGSWITIKVGYDWVQMHIYLGYFTLGLLLFRVLWGFVGPRHARFGQFLRGPRATWRYARSLGQRDSPPSVGHNPLGAWMVMAMLAMLVFQAVSGLFASDDILYAGPYNGAVTQGLADRLTRLHKQNFNLLIVSATALHLLAITYYAWHKRQNLLRPMLSGRKPVQLVPAGQAIESSRVGRALLLAVLCAIAVYLLISMAPPPAPIDYF